MNDLKKFNADAVQSFAQIAKEKYDEKITRMAEKYLRVIDSKYEAKIKKEVSRNPNIRAIKIKLPKLGRPVSVKEADLVEKEMNEKLRERGFNVVLIVPSNCDCIFNAICLYKEFYATFSW